MTTNKNCEIVEKRQCRDSDVDKEKTFHHRREMKLLLQRYLFGRQILKRDRLDLVPLYDDNDNTFKCQKYYSGFSNMIVLSHPRTSLVIRRVHSQDPDSGMFQDISNVSSGSVVELFELTRAR